MNEIIYEGPFKEHLKNHIGLKQAVGYTYESEERALKRFDRYTLNNYPSATVLTKQIVLDWCDKKSYESKVNQCSRASIIRQFGKYLDSIGVQAYIIPTGYYPSGKQYLPHIYTTNELRTFFAQTDSSRYCSACPVRHLIMPLFFRMIYSCGLRVSEARLLKVEDVDLENGILAIHHSKKDHSRLVALSDNLAQRCGLYSKKVHPFPKPDAYYFPGQDAKPMTITNVYKNFRRFLWGAGISHGGRGRGPRIHDFRHTYAVHCLKKWVKQDKDLMTYLPVLKTYMGHNSFKETAYYLRMTADVFPDITMKLETQYPTLIPSLEGGAYETY